MPTRGLIDVYTAACSLWPCSGRRRGPRVQEGQGMASGWNKDKDTEPNCWRPFLPARQSPAIHQSLPHPRHLLLLALGPQLGKQVPSAAPPPEASPVSAWGHLASGTHAGLSRCPTAALPRSLPGSRRWHDPFASSQNHLPRSPRPRVYMTCLLPPPSGQPCERGILLPCTGPKPRKCLRCLLSPA